MKLSVVVSTYNQPEWLEKVLHGYLLQTHRDFEILVADDGSREETRQTIMAFVKERGREVAHIWEEDEGFQKSRILNKAILAAAGDYLIFTDGDCIPRPDFVATHVRHAEPSVFLSGGYCKLPMNVSIAIDRGNIDSGEAFDPAWLRGHGFRRATMGIKLTKSRPLAVAADFLTTRKATWNGCNSSTWKEAILAVNGHNEDMQYGGEDREMGERLMNYGYKSKQIRHQAVLLHLDHERSYKTPESLRKNKLIRDEVRATRSVWCTNGIRKSPQP